MSDAFPNYPRGGIAMGNGDLVQVTNVKGKYTNGAKLKHSIKKTPSGYTLGHREVSGTFETEVPEGGMERDWWDLVRNGTVKQVRIKFPGTTKALDIVCSDLDFELPSDDAIKKTIGFIGQLVDS